MHDKRGRDRSNVEIPFRNGYIESISRYGPVKAHPGMPFAGGRYLEMIMRQEIERKFLVTGSGYRNGASCKTYRQGYIVADTHRVIRVRTDGSKGYLTIKGPSRGASRTEYEYEIPLPDAEDLLERMCIKPLIEKVRYTLVHDGMTWEVDEFTGVNQGLCIAEIELEQEDQRFSLPPWVGREVTADPRYYNAYLAKHPYNTWEHKD
ncbi:CYTH domain-containing protein [Thermoclostridium caenicola]|nr:CYTH domain-containing protein [Thermoclostridium caenicola]HOL84046.1 CYTH domain-containing protein [Thermoclostridium caenicola]HOP71946.1 CYTH domain-containing protein [Thermoclostridium caenicola]HPO76935.1 CYTH domain-containing protein [Thermoclostridium caenicola]